MPRFLFDKLIRDKLIQSFAESGQKADYEKLNLYELRHALKQKLLEESKEIPLPKVKDDDLIGEITDLQEVLDSLKAAYDISDDEVNDKQALKRLKNGGFADRIFLKSIEVTDGDPWLAKYRQDPDKYPEVKQSVDVDEVIKLSRLLGEYGEIKRATLLPNGEKESDSHHAFSLALIALDFADKHLPMLDKQKMLQFALTHDLIELITGDADTLLLSQAQLAEKIVLESEAQAEFETLMKPYRSIMRAFNEYEKLDTPESVTVYVLDKACTIWTHFPDKAESLQKRGIRTSGELEAWYNKQLEKIKNRAAIDPPEVAMKLFEVSFLKLAALLPDDYEDQI